MDYIANQGGGTLVFEVGRYLTGSLHLPPNVNIQLNEGAILVGSPNPYDYDLDNEGNPQLIHPDNSRLCGLGYIERQ